MNSSKLNMYAAGIIGSLLIFMLLGFFSDLIFSGGHEEEEGPLAYAVEVEDGGEVEETAEAIDWAALVATADPAKGEKLFGKCKACHKVQDGVNGVGPSLWGVVGRGIATVAGSGMAPKCRSSNEAAFPVITAYEIYGSSANAPMKP